LESRNGRDNFEHRHRWEDNNKMYLKGTGVKMTIRVKFIWLRIGNNGGLLATQK
jgi:hypothetical protein